MNLDKLKEKARKEFEKLILDYATGASYDFDPKRWEGTTLPMLLDRLDSLLTKVSQATRERDIATMMKKAREYHNAKMYPKTYLRAAEQFESVLNNLE